MIYKLIRNIFNIDLTSILNSLKTNLRTRVHIWNTIRGYKISYTYTYELPT